jgi:anti-sigma regulatory factor (Ser/Thr protein kinase)
VRHDRTTRTTPETAMAPTPDSTPARPRTHRRGGAARALTCSWREALIPLAAADGAAVSLLRALTRRILDGWKIPTPLIDDIELAVSELATNALIHTAGPVRVRLAHRDGTVRLDVADTSPHQPAPAAPGAEAEHGRGLILVAALAARMRVEPYPGHPNAGKITIVEFDLG